MLRGFSQGRTASARFRRQALGRSGAGRTILAHLLFHRAPRWPSLRSAMGNGCSRGRVEVEHDGRRDKVEGIDGPPAGDVYVLLPGTRKRWAGRPGHAECSIARLSILTVYRTGRESVCTFQLRSGQATSLTWSVSGSSYGQHGIVSSLSHGMSGTLLYVLHVLSYPRVPRTIRSYSS